MLRGLRWNHLFTKGTHKIEIHKSSHEIAFAAFTLEHAISSKLNTRSDAQCARFYNDAALVLFYHRTYKLDWHWASLFQNIVLSLYKLPTTHLYTATHSKRLLWQSAHFKTTSTTEYYLNARRAPKRYLFVWWVLQTSSFITLCHISTFSLRSQKFIFNSTTQLYQNVEALPL